MISLEQAQTIITRHLSDRNLDSERIPVTAATARVLAADVTSGLDIPPFDRVTMDGFAVAEGEAGNRLEVVGEVRAGQVREEPIRPGSAVKVMTGAPAPPGTGKVIMVESCREANGYVEIAEEALAAEGRNIAARGEDLRVGDVVVPAGERLNTLHIAGLVACGVAEVKVHRQPRVVVMATGDELVEEPDLLRDGQIPNSNSPLLSGVLRSFGYSVEVYPVVPDDPQVTLDRISGALWNAEMVVLTGGVSAGDYDFVPAALQEMGREIHISKIAIKPGKPLIFATSDRGVVFGLPGNPVSAFVTCHLFVLPALALLEGTLRRERYVTLPLAQPYHGRGGPRLKFLPARLTADGRIACLPYHGSGHLHALAEADGLLRVEPEVTELATGTGVLFWPVRTAAFQTPTREGKGAM